MVAFFLLATCIGIPLVAGYLCGSLAFSLWVPLLLKKGDPRQIGSKSVGTTNVFRLAGLPTAILVFLGDFLKGFLPVFLCTQPQYAGLIGIGCVLGHIFPLFAGFRGGKGVATAMGVMIAMDPWLLPLFLCVWGTLWYVLRYVSVASLVTICVGTLWFLYKDLAEETSFTHSACSTLLMLIVLCAHRKNLYRLYKKTEPKTSM